MGLGKGEGEPVGQPYYADNPIISAGYSTDGNGKLIHDGTNGNTWDRANRLRAMVGASYGFLSFLRLILYTKLEIEVVSSILAQRV
ncbi:MAG: hypothetical protein JNM70_19975 [Anaerolineae bacterium]|nr:hypothetical protein [Anaerolineae bacterium]